MKEAAARARETSMVAHLYAKTERLDRTLQEVSELDNLQREAAAL